MTGLSKTKVCSTSATCWYDWIRDCAVKIITHGSSELISQNYCILLDCSRMYIFGDGPTWTINFFTYHVDDEGLVSEDQEGGGGGGGA
jgi:hypothetical protein